MGMFSKLKDFVVGADDARQLKNAPVATEGSGEAVNADYTVETDRPLPVHKTTSEMTQEELKRRRINLVESAKFGRPAHESIMMFLLRIWLVIAPPAFVLLTASEVAYILTKLVPPADRFGNTVIWGGALFLDVSFMFATFGLALKIRDLSEKREAIGYISKREQRDIYTGVFIWFVFAVINIISQTAFLLHVIQASGSKDMTILYVFVASRVIGFVLGDASTAFFLAKVDNSHLKLIARAEREKAAIYRDIASAEGERSVIEAKAEADILIIQLEVKQKIEDVEFLAVLKRQMFDEVLTRRNALPQPNKSTVRRLDTGS